MHKPKLCLDFDGVCHQYITPWKDVTTIPDDVVPGAFAAIKEYTKAFNVYVYSSRSNSPEGIRAMKDWFIDHGWKHTSREPDNLLFPDKKPPFYVALDDRVLTFTGKWPSAKKLMTFKPWNKGGKHRYPGTLRTKATGYIIVTVGIQASGKSTWAKQQVILDGTTYRRVNKDELRAMIDIGKYTSSREEQICAVRDNIIEYYVKNGYGVIVDDTNLNPKHWIQLNALADTLSCQIYERFFWISLEEALYRNSHRDIVIPEDAIHRAWNQYIAPKLKSSGKDYLEYYYDNEKIFNIEKT